MESIIERIVIIVKDATSDISGKDNTFTFIRSDFPDDSFTSDHIAHAQFAASWIFTVRI